MRKNRILTRAALGLLIGGAEAIAVVDLTVVLCFKEQQK